MLITEYVLPAEVQTVCKNVAGFYRPYNGHLHGQATVKITATDEKLQAHTAPQMATTPGAAGSMIGLAEVNVPLIWLRTQPKLVADIYETELAEFRRVKHSYDENNGFTGKGYTKNGKAGFGCQVYFQTTVDRLRCVSAAFPDHIGLAELRDEAMLLEATSVLLEAAKRR